MQKTDENYDYKYRLDLMWHEYNGLVELIEEAKKSNIHINSNLLEKVQNYKKIKISPAKLNAIAKASEMRTEKAKEKFKAAVVKLSSEGIELTAYKIAKTANISFATAKKYLKLFNENE